jgi:P pilus assembly chaperone PapD
LNYKIYFGYYATIVFLGGNIVLKQKYFEKYLVIARCKALCLVAMLGLPCASQAVSLTTYRIYLDNDNRIESFILFSKGVANEDCKARLAHYNFDAQGQMSNEIKGKELPEHSAKPWIRYSPKQFTITPGKPQTVRLILRRKANAEPKEYRSYLSILCHKAVPATAPNIIQDRPTFSLKPNLIQNVPIVVRTGRLEATASFTDMLIKDKMLTVNLTRQGNRSIYGEIRLTDKKNGQVYAQVSGVSLYNETTSYALKYNLSKLPELSNLQLEFIEDKNYGGSLLIKQDVILN